MVILPAPTFLSPSHAKAEPVPVSGPSNVFLQFGSSFAHGDQLYHLRRSFTSGKILGRQGHHQGGAFDVEFIRFRGGVGEQGADGNEEEEQNGPEHGEFLSLCLFLIHLAAKVNPAHRKACENSENPYICRGYQ